MNVNSKQICEHIRDKTGKAVTMHDSRNQRNKANRDERDEKSKEKVLKKRAQWKSEIKPSRLHLKFGD